MPIDISTHFANFSDNAAMSAFGRAFAHPISLSIIIVSIVMLITYNMTGFKSFFYVLSTVVIAVIIHDTMNESQIKQQYEHKYAVSMSNTNIPQPQEFEPAPYVEAPLTLDQLEQRLS